MNENADEIVSKMKMHALEDTCRICDAYIMNAAASLIENLQALLSESQRRERAAVEDIADFIVERGDCLRIALDTQDRHYLEQLIRQWRGPHDEKGE